MNCNSEGTFPNWAFPNKHVEKRFGFVMNSGVTQVVLFGFRWGIFMNLAYAVNCVPLSFREPGDFGHESKVMGE